MTQDHKTSTFGNRLLDGLPLASQQALMPLFRRLPLARGAVTTHAGERIDHIDFPIDSVIAVVAATPGGKTIETVAIGGEGYVQTDPSLGSGIALRSAVCRLPGSVQRMSIDAFRILLRDDSAFADAIRRATRARMYVMEQAVLCNAHHTMDQRLARWLLEARDRSGKEHFKVTQAELAGVLGVRRAGISLTVARLRRAGAVANERGGMMVTDYERLRGEACECYGLIRDAVAGVLE